MLIVTLKAEASIVEEEEDELGASTPSAQSQAQQQILPSKHSPPINTPMVLPIGRSMDEVKPAEAQEALLSRTIYLQLGREVKKAVLATEPSITSLSLLFTERFQYAPDLVDFPAIYVRDPRSGVQYELEDMSEVRDGSLLSLNIERK